MSTNRMSLFNSSYDVTDLSDGDDVTIPLLTKDNENDDEYKAISPLKSRFFSLRIKLLQALLDESIVLFNEVAAKHPKRPVNVKSGIAVSAGAIVTALILFCLSWNLKLNEDKLFKPTSPDMGNLITLVGILFIGMGTGLGAVGILRLKKLFGIGEQARETWVDSEPNYLIERGDPKLKEILNVFNLLNAAGNHDSSHAEAFFEDIVKVKAKLNQIEMASYTSGKLFREKLGVDMSLDFGKRLTELSIPGLPDLDEKVSEVKDYWANAKRAKLI